MSKNVDRDSVASHCSSALLHAAAVDVVRASAVGDQNFIPCLLQGDAETVRLRLAIYRMAEVLKDYGKGCQNCCGTGSRDGKDCPACWGGKLFD